MKKILILITLVGALSSAYAGPLRQQKQQQRQDRQQKLQPGGRLNGVRPAVARSLVEDSVYRFYVKQFQQDPDITSDVLGKILPFIDEFVQNRFAITQRRTRALNQLRQAMTRNAPEEELNRFVRDFDAADSDFQSNQEKFLTNVDPLLNARQRARVRVLQNVADNRIRQMLNEVQNPPANQNQPPREP